MQRLPGMAQRLPKRFLLYAGITVVVLLALYSLLGFALLPHLIEQRMPAYTRANLGAEVTAADVSFNPFTLTLRARGLRMVQQQDKLLASARDASIDLQWSSLWRPGWHFDAALVDGLALHLVLEEDGQLNLVRLGNADGRRAAQPSQPSLPQVALEHARVTHGRVTFTDLTGAEPAQAALRWVDAGLDDITTMTDESGRYVASAVLPGGGALAFQGRVTLSPIASQGELRVVGLQLATPWQFVRDMLRIAKPGGRVDAGLSYDFAYAAGKARVGAKQLWVHATDLLVSPEDRPDEPALALAVLNLDGGVLDWNARKLTFAHAVLRQGRVGVSVASDGQVDWQHLFRTDEAAREAPAGDPFRVGIDQVAIQDVALRYTNRSTKTPMHLEAKGIDAGLRLAVAAGGGATEVTAEDIELETAGLKLAPRDGPAALVADTVQLHGGRLTLADRALVLPNVKLSHGGLLFAVDQQGGLNWTQMFAAKDQTQGQPAPKEEAGWRIRLPGLRAEAMRTRYVDRSRVHPFAADIDAVSGGLDLAIIAGSDSPVQVEQIDLAARGLSLHGVGQAQSPALTLKSAGTRTGHYRDDELVLEGMHLDQGTLRWLVGEDRRSNWEQLLAMRVAKPTAQRTTGSARSGLRIRLPGLQANGLALEYRDRSRLRPVAVDVAQVDAALSLSSGRGGSGLQARDVRLSGSGLSIGPIDTPGRALTLQTFQAGKGSFSNGALILGSVALSGGKALLEVAEDGKLNWAQLFARAPSADSSTDDASSGTSSGTAFIFRSPAIALGELSLRYVDRRRARTLTLTTEPVDVDLALRVDTSGAGTTTVAANDIDLDVPGIEIATPDRETPLASLGPLNVAGGRIDTAAKTMGAERVAVSGGALHIVRDEAGEVLPVSLLQASAGGTTAPASRAAATAQDWHYHLGTFSLDSFDITLRDQAQAPALSYEATVQTLTLQNLGSAGKSPGTVEARVTTPAGGVLEGSGKVTVSPAGGHGQVQVSGLDLRPLQPLLARYARLELTGGNLSGHANVDYQQAARDAGLKVTGAATIDALQVQEAGSDEPFLAWRRAQADAITYTSLPARLEVGSVRIDAPRGKLEISRDRKVNVAQVLKPDDSATHAASPPPSQAQTPGNEQLEVQVDRLRIADGTLHFADHSLVLPFERDIASLDATIVNLSNRPAVRARLEANGDIAPYGLAKASGGIDLSSPRDFTDIRAQFENVKLPPLSPYTITFAGRAVASGTLWLDVRYRIDDGELAGTNDVTIQNLELGEKVEGANTRDLPLDLAVALLTDDQGRFRVRVPVRGDLDNPHFDYAKVIRSAIADSLQRVVTAPFRFIGRLFGGSENLDNIAFEAGSAELTPPQQDKLNTVAKALQERPQVSLIVRPGFAPQADAQALREDQLKREIARRSGVELDPGEEPGPIAFSRAQTRRALRGLAQERLGSDALIQRAQGRGGETDAYYEDLYRRLLEKQTLPATPRELAQQRNEQIVEYLSRSGVAPRRITAGDPEQVEATEDAVETELRLKAGGG